MKRKILFLFGIMLMLVIASNIMINLSINRTSTVEISSEKLHIVTSFYPVYMIGVNLFEQQDSIEVNSLTDINTGCLHDYQLTTRDMKLISGADIMIINGGGMEGFLEEIINDYPDLTIINASEGITMLPENATEIHDDNKGTSVIGAERTSEAEAVPTENSSEHDHGEWNAHVWLDPKLYIKQIENVKAGLDNYLERNRTASSTIIQAIEANANNYIRKINALDIELNQLLDKHDIQGGQDSQYKAVIFHDAFAYLADNMGLEVAYSIPLDSDTALSAGDIAELVREVKSEGIRYLFTEEQYSDSIAKQIEAETAAKVYIIDSAVTGDGSKDSYLMAMKKNIEVLRKALQQE